MRLDALNWNIKWQQNAVCTRPLFSSATIHFTGHEDEAGCPGFKSISEDCSCHLLPNRKMIAVVLVSKWLPRATYRNSKLFVENDKCWALAGLEEQSSQPGSWRWLSFSQCKMGHSLRVTLCQFWNKHGKQSPGSRSYILHITGMNVWIMQNYKYMKMALRASILAVNILIFNHLALYSHSTLFTTYLPIPVFQACIEKSSSRIVLNHLEKSGAHTGPLSHGGLHTCLTLCSVEHPLWNQRAIWSAQN